MNDTATALGPLQTRILAIIREIHAETGDGARLRDIAARARYKTKALCWAMQGLRDQGYIVNVGWGKTSRNLPAEATNAPRSEVRKKLSRLPGTDGLTILQHDVLTALEELHERTGDGVPLASLAAHLRLDPATVSNALYKLRNKARSCVTSTGRGALNWPGPVPSCEIEKTHKADFIVPELPRQPEDDSVDTAEPVIRFLRERGRSVEPLRNGLWLLDGKTVTLLRLLSAANDLRARAGAGLFVVEGHQMGQSGGWSLCQSAMPELG